MRRGGEMVSGRLIPYILAVTVAVSVGLAQTHIGVRLVPPPNGEFAMKDMWALWLNTTGGPATVYLYGYVEVGADRVVECTTSNALHIDNGQHRVTARDILGVRGVKYSQAYGEFVKRGAQLPEGDYTFCVEVYDSATTRQLGRQCITVRVRHPSPSRLIRPPDGSTLTTPLLEFVWTPPMPRLSGVVTYELKLYEVKNGQTPIEAAAANPEWFKQAGMVATSLKYPTRANALRQGMTFAWYVIARAAGIPGGLKSQVFSSNVRGMPPSPEPTSPPPGTAAIQLVAPIGPRQPFRPDFKWRPLGKPPKGLTYSLVLTELSQDCPAESSMVVFRRSAIRGTSLPFPADVSSLDSGTVYAWMVAGIVDDHVVLRSSVGLFNAKDILKGYCGFALFPDPDVDSKYRAYYEVCAGGDVTLCGRFTWGNINGTVNWTLTEAVGNSDVGSGSIGSVPISGSVDICVPLHLTAPGLHKYRLKATIGTCPATLQWFQVLVYPSVQDADIVKEGGGSLQNTEVCENDAGLLVVPSLTYVTSTPELNWWYHDLQWMGTDWSSTWSEWKPCGTGNGLGTHAFGAPPAEGDPAGCPCMFGKFQRQYRVEYGPADQITPTNEHCMRKVLNPVTVFCKPAGTATGGGQYCGAQPVVLSVTDYTGSSFQWYEKQNSNLLGPLNTDLSDPSLTLSPTPGVHMYVVKVSNGPCDPLELDCPVQVFELLSDCGLTFSVPLPAAPHITGDHMSEVCPNDDATLTLTGLPGTVTNFEILWEYLVNCDDIANDWTPALELPGNSTSYNTNELGSLGPYSNPDPFTSLCVRATITNPDYLGTGPCRQVTTQPWHIDFVKEICKPTIECTGPWQDLPCTKCPNASVRLTATFPFGCKTDDYSLRWLCDGSPYTGLGATMLTIDPTAAGFYSLRVYSEYTCQSVESDAIEVKNCAFDMVIECTPSTVHPGTEVTLKVSDMQGEELNFSTCGGEYTYEWTDADDNVVGTTRSISVTPVTGIPPPCGTDVTYKVKVTDGRGCWVEAVWTVLVCPTPKGE
jgi:hypothetical protein